MGQADSLVPISHAVTDNYSRKILAWTVGERLNPMNTCNRLKRAAPCLSKPETKVDMDSGAENLNKDVDKLHFARPGYGTRCCRPHCSARER